MLALGAISDWYGPENNDWTWIENQALAADVIWLFQEG